MRCPRLPGKLLGPVFLSRRASAHVLDTACPTAVGVDDVSMRRCSVLKIAVCLVALVVAVCFLPVFLKKSWHFIGEHGVFLPPFPHLYTTPYDPSSASSLTRSAAKARPSPGLAASTPPDKWEAPFRVVLSLTTLPENIPRLRATLGTLTRQDTRVDAILLNLPRFNRRLNIPYPDDLPSWLTDPEQFGRRVTVNRLDVDFGPVTKLVGALLHENDPDTLIITVDDDKVYKPNMVRHLAWAAHRDPSNAYGFCGWGFWFVFKPRGVVPVYVPWWMRGNGRYVDVLQACCGNAYRRRFFPDLDTLKNAPKQCFTTDDLWIAGNLQHQNVPRVILPGPWSVADLGSSHFDAKDPEWKRSASREHALSHENLNEGKDISCIESIQQQFGHDFRTAVNTFGGP